MASWNCRLVLLFCLFSPLKAENEDSKWRGEMEEQMRKLAAMVEDQGRIIKGQNSEIAALKERIVELETKSDAKEASEKQIHSSIHKTDIKIDHIIKTMKEQQKPFPSGLQKRLLLDSPIVHETPIAFYAYISHDFTHVGDNHVFVYDTVLTNSGHAYSNYSGVFTAPSSGMYAFAYSIAVAGHHISGDHHSNFGEISVQLVRNASPVGSIAADTETANEDEMATGFAVLYLDAGDIVRVVAPSQGQGSFQSNTYEYWTFSGFRIK